MRGTSRLEKVLWYRIRWRSSTASTLTCCLKNVCEMIWIPILLSRLHRISIFFLYLNLILNLFVCCSLLIRRCTELALLTLNVLSRPVDSKYWKFMSWPWKAIHSPTVSFCSQPYVPVKEQIDPDPDFSTVKFPNPEEGKATLNLALATARRHQSTVVIANDPDADRLACAELQPRYYCTVDPCRHCYSSVLLCYKVLMDSHFPAGSGKFSMAMSWALCWAGGCGRGHNRRAKIRQLLPCSLRRYRRKSSKLWRIAKDSYLKKRSPDSNGWVTAGSSCKTKDTKSSLLLKVIFVHEQNIRVVARPRSEIDPLLGGVQRRSDLCAASTFRTKTA